MSKIATQLLLLPALFLLGIFFVLPALDVIVQSFLDPDLTIEHYAKLFSNSFYWAVMWRTLLLSAVTALAATVLGWPVAYWIARQDKNVQVVMILLFLVPMWMSVLIRSYAWTVVLGREGIINSSLQHLGLIDAPLKLLFTGGAVYAALIQILLPVQIIASYNALREVEPDFLRAARIMGASPLQTIRRIVLPLSLDGTITGTCIVFLMTAGFFVTPAILGGPKYSMLANQITMQVDRLETGFAGALGVMLLVVMLIGVTLIKLAGKVIARGMVG
jgi:putative spermidine/putrescine transport system permease protein